MIELYHFRNSICSERSRMVLHEKGITDWVSHHVDLFTGEQFAPAYVALNPKAETPTLVVDGHVIRESALICEYIDDAFPDPPLKPETPEQVASLREWVKWCDDQLYEAVAALSFVSVFRATMNGMGRQAKEAHYRKVTDLSRLMRQRSCVENGFASPYVIRGVNNAGTLLGRMDQALADGRPWLMGERYTLADLAYSPFLARLAALDMLEPLLGETPAAAAWWARCMERPSFTAAEVGPAQGEEADRYRTHGAACRAELTELLERLATREAYDIVSGM